MRRDIAAISAGLFGVAASTYLYVKWLGVSNGATVAATFLLIVLLVAAWSTFAASAVVSIAAVLAFNYFFLPPVGTFTIADPQNWIALFTLLAVSLIASNLSALARKRTEEANARRDELARLFDISRDILITTEGREAVTSLARSVARRFDLGYVAIAIPKEQSWELHEAGALAMTLDESELAATLAGAQHVLEFDASQRTTSGHRVTEIDGHSVLLIPLRMGTKPIGILAASGRVVDAGALDALGAVLAIAIERAALLDQRKAAEIARRSEDLKTALLASIAHDLRTPLAAVRVAASNLQSPHLSADQLHEQGALIVGEAERLGRLFENILEMARIDAGAISSEARWAHPSEIIVEARAQVERTLRDHRVRVDVDPDTPVRVDPRLTASALAHILENAAQYAPRGSEIDVTATVSSEGLRLRVRDRGPGIAAADLPRLFERFYRGDATEVHTTGTGMGLAIARGLVAAELGSIWAENCSDGGAQFTIQIPAESKVLS